MVRSTIVAVLSLFFPALAVAQSDDFGKWISLFNGKDAVGWINAKPQTQGGDKNRWTVEDGALTNETKGVNDACTVEEFEDYELEIEYKVPKGGNSGVYLRGAIEVQVLDSHGRQPTEHDAGAIYGGFIPLANPSKPAGEWNEFRVLHIGSRITVWHNDVLVQDNVLRADKTPGEMPEHPKSKNRIDGRKGPIMLQGDHEKVWYRNIRIRPLFAAAAGWKPLWNGKDLSELTARDDRRAKDGLDWKVEDGAFTNAKHSSQGHDIWTKEPFRNFLVHYAYRSDPRIEGGNSGFYLRDQWEIQIARETKLDDKHSDGCLYSIHTPLVAARHKPDQWNHMDVKVEGMKIWVWQNGKLLHDGRICETRTDNHGEATKALSRAPFKLQGDHGKVWFTSLYIKPLPDSGPSD